MAEHEICLLTLSLNHIGHVDNTGEDRSISVFGFQEPTTFGAKYSLPLVFWPKVTDPAARCLR